MPYPGGDDHDNEDIVLLPNNLFVNLLDLELQDRILKVTDLDFNVSNALERLLDGELSNLTNDLDDWKVESLENGKAIFYREKMLKKIQTIAIFIFYFFSLLFYNS